MLPQVRFYLKFARQNRTRATFYSHLFAVFRATRPQPESWVAERHSPSLRADESGRLFLLGELYCDGIIHCNDRFSFSACNVGSGWSTCVLSVNMAFRPSHESVAFAGRTGSEYRPRRIVRAGGCRSDGKLIRQRHEPFHAEGRFDGVATARSQGFAALTLGLGANIQHRNAQVESDAKSVALLFSIFEQKTACRCTPLSPRATWPTPPKSAKKLGKSAKALGHLLLAKRHLPPTFSEYPVHSVPSLLSELSSCLELKKSMKIP